MLRSPMVGGTPSNVGTPLGGGGQPPLLVSGIPILVKCLHTIFQSAVDHQNNIGSLSSTISSSDPRLLGSPMVPASAVGVGGVHSNITNSERKAKSIPIYPLLIYFLMPQVKTLLYNYTDDICKEISSQVRQDSWNYLKAPSLTIKILSNIEAANVLGRSNVR